MTDSLFLMQRYWGSDEDDDDQPDCTNSKNKISESEPAHKRQKLNPAVIELGSDVEEIQDSNCLDSVTKNFDLTKTTNLKLKSSKKRKKSVNGRNELPQSSHSQPVSSDLYTNNKNIQEVDLKDSVEIISVKKSNFTKPVDLEEKSFKKPNNSPKDKKLTSKEIQREFQESSSTHSCIPRNSTQTDSPSENTGDTGYDSNEKDETPKRKTKGLKKPAEKERECVEDNLLSSTAAENVEKNFCTIGKVQEQKARKVRQALPQWLSNPTYISVDLEEKKTPVSEFTYLDSNTKKNLKEAGFEFLFPVQLAVIPWLMQSKDKSLLIRPSDICVSAPTGSGKTLAFVLPIIQSLKERVVCAIRALIVLPVGELAFQVFKVFQAFTKGTDLKVTLLTGKKAFLEEQNSLVKCVGNKVQSLTDIVVATPGRICDHIYKTKGFCLKRLQYLVIDEADRMLDEIQQGWLKKIEEAVFQDCFFPNCICSNNKRTSLTPTSAFNFGLISLPLQKLLYSATLTHDPEQLHSLSLYKPKLFKASSNIAMQQDFTRASIIPNKLNMFQVVCEEGIKPVVVCHLIKQLQFKKVLCFTESVERAHRLHLLLEEIGLFHVRELSSFNRAVQRKIVIEQFSSGKIDILVCSDIVARGFDIEDIDCVISYDVPQAVKIYIHRIGRTARAGKNGTAITLLSRGEIPHFKQILNSAKIEIPRNIDINNKELEPFISSYQKALIASEMKLKQEKSHAPGKPSQKNRRKIYNKM